MPLLSLPNDPLRQALVAELHLRRFPLFGTAGRGVQLVMRSAEAESAAERAAAEGLCRRCGAPPPPPGRHFIAELGAMSFVWERHAEFATYTFLAPRADCAPFETALLDLLPEDWLASLPGEVLRATLIHVAGPAAPAPSTAQIDACFADPDPVGSTLAQDRARIWSAFRVHQDGFGRLLIHNRSLEPGELARLVQQVQELGNYRTMALLGLPEAQRLTPELSSLEARLTALTADMESRGFADDKLLHDLVQLSAELARLSAKTSYRMSATAAYAELAMERLRNLAVGRIDGYQTLAEFTERRLAPAVRTCASFSRRLHDLSNRAAWASSLLRTRIDTAIEQQSRDLLASMDRRTDLQLRLQQAVEGLSVAAISYYLVGLAGYVAKGLHERWANFDPELAQAVTVPVAVLAVWYGLHRLRKRHQGTAGP